ncbi:MAG: hypothetical protein RIM72_17080 [Alphaproteobacteria bacterium]
MIWPVEFLLFLIGFSVSAFVIRFLSSTLPQPGRRDGLTHLWGGDFTISVKVGLVPATAMTVLTNI